MRNLPNVTIISDNQNKDDSGITDLKKWLDTANSDDLHALYSGEITNNTYYQLHDLMFSLHYTHESARYYRYEILSKLRELVAGEMNFVQIKEKAAYKPQERKKLFV